MGRISECNLLAVHRGKCHRFAKIIFRKDGSIFILFPSFTKKEGLVAVATLRAGVRGEQTMNLAEIGKVTSHRVKYSHHPDGRAHFSQHGKVKAMIKTMAAPLTSAHGHFFTIETGGLHGFDPPRANDTAMALTFMIDDDPSGLKVLCHRYNMSKFTPQNPAFGGVSPAEVGGMQAISWNGKEPVTGVFIAPPKGYALDNFGLFLRAMPLPYKPSNRELFLAFFGGFDDSQAALDFTKDTSFLTLLYPCSDPNRLAKAIGSIDL